MTEQNIDILLIEDNPGDVMLIREMLAGARHHQFEIREADRLSTALELLAGSNPGIVLLDLSLPDSSGLNTLRKVSAKYPELPVIILTGSKDDLLGVNAVTQGAQDYLVKGETDSRTLTKAIHYAMERKRVETALRVNELLLSKTQQIAHLGSWSFNLTDNHLTWSDEMFRIYGVDRKEFEITPESFLCLIHPDDRALMTEWITNATSGLHPVAIEFRVIHPGGRERWILGGGELNMDASGKPKYLVGTALDITDRKLTELQRKLSTNILSTLNRPNDWPDLIRDIIGQIREFTGIEAVGIRLLEGEDFPYHHAIGFPSGFFQEAQSLRERDAQGNFIRRDDGKPCLACLCGQIIEGRTNPSKSWYTQKGSFWTNDLSSIQSEKEIMEETPFLRTHCLEGGYQSVALIPVKSGKGIVGSLQFNDHRPGRFTHEMIGFFEDIGKIVGVAFQRIRNEQEIKDAEERFHTLFNNLIIGVYRTTPDGRILLVNPSLLRMLGFNSLEEIQQRNLEQDGFGPGYEREGFKKRLEENGIITGLESVWKREDGSALFIRESARIVRDESGNAIWYEGTVEDITEKKQSDEALRISEARYRNIFDYAPLGIYQSTRNGRILTANTKFASLLGYETSDETLKLDMAKDLYFDPALRDRLIDMFEPGGTATNVDLQWKRKGGAPLWINLTSHAIKDSEGETLYFEGFISDATERKKTEEIFGSLNAGAMKIQRAVNRDEVFAGISAEIRSMGGHCAIFEVDNDQQVIHTRYHSYDAETVSSVEKILGVPSAGYTIPLNAVAEYRQVIDQQKSLFIEDNVTFFLKQIFPDLTEEIVRKFSNRHKLSQAILSPIIDQEKVIGLFTVRAEKLTQRDLPAIEAFAHQIAGAWIRTELYEKANVEIEHRKNIEIELVEAKEKAEESDRLKSSLLNNMSHEFRTPMNAILGFSAFLESETTGNPELHQMASRINNAGNRLMKTLDDILELSQLQAGFVTGQKKEIDLYENLVALLPGYRETASRKNLNLTLNARSKPFVQMDAGHLSQALDHLIGNAIKFTEEGDISIDISIQQEGLIPWVHLDIKDTGIGIHPQNHDLIFDAFRQASEGYGRIYEGTGLGLTIAKRIVESYGGVILVESIVGKGSTFTIRLPMAGSAEKPEPVTGYLLTEKQGMPDEEQNRPAIRSTYPDTIRILLVEDNEDNVEVVRMFLEKQAKIDVAYNGELAIERCKSHLFDLILMDINLGSGKDGLDATREIRKLQAFDRIPVIAVTGFTTPEDKARIFDAGCSHYLGKPFTKEQLQNTIKDAVLWTKTR